jgi:hypothetical protein
VLLLFCAALLLAVIAILKKKERDPERLKWTVLACGFLVMAFDEALSFHEKLAEPMRRLLGDDVTLGVFYYAWVLPGMALVLVLAFYFLRFLLRLPAPTRLHFLVAGALYIGGAIGIELLGGRYEELYGDQSLTYSMIATLEESLEMAGVIVFIYALFHYIFATYEEVRFRLAEDQDFREGLAKREILMIRPGLTQNQQLAEGKRGLR